MERSHINPLHTGPSSGFDPQVGILVDAAVGWCRAKSAGRLQEDVWFRFVPGGVLGRDDRIEPTLQANVRNLFHNDVAEAATGHRHGELPFIFPNNRGNRLDFDERMYTVEERFFLFLGDSDDIERHIHLVRQHSDDLVTGNASQCIESVFGEFDSKPTHCLVAREEMKGHRVSQSAVAIENEGLNHRANQGVRRRENRQAATMEPAGKSLLRCSSILNSGNRANAPTSGEQSQKTTKRGRRGRRTQLD